MSMSETRTAVLVGCGSSKRDEKCMAWRMYIKNYADWKMSAAMMMGEPYIISAKHGLIPAFQRIETYEESNGDKSAEELDAWGRDVVRDLPDHYDRVIIFGGRDYAEPVLRHLPDAVEAWDPFDEFGGNGSQMGWCKSAAQSIRSGESVEAVLSEIASPQ